MDAKEIQRHRMLKFRSIGGFQEGMPVEPEKKRNMKPSDVNTSLVTNIESELENLKKKILGSKGPADAITKDTIEKIEQEVDQEITDALIAMGLEEKIESVKLELSKPSNQSPDQPLNQNIQEKVDKIMQEFNSKLSQPGAYLGLKHKLQKLETVNKLIEMKVRQEKLKAEINQRVSHDLKTKIANLKNLQERLSNGNSPNKELVEEAEKAKKELGEVLRSANLEVVRVMKRKVDSPPPSAKQKIIEMNNEIISEIDRVVNAEEGIKEKLKELENEVAKGSSAAKDVKKMETDIKESILSALNVTALKEKIDTLKMEVESESGEANENKIEVENGRN